MKKVFKSITRTTLFIRVGGVILFFVFLLITPFYRFRLNDHLKRLISEQKPVIIAFWHQNILVMILFLFRISRYRRRIAVLISPSYDGEWAAFFLKLLNMHTIRASSYKNPVKGGMQLLKYLQKENSALALAVDGPRGPRHSIQPGVFALAARSKKPVVPVQITVSRKRCFSSWDKCVFPLPFAAITMETTEEIHIEENFDLKEEQTKLKKLLGHENEA